MTHHNKLTFFLNNEEFNAFKAAAYAARFRIEYAPFCNSDGAFNSDAWNIKKGGEFGRLYKQSANSYRIGVGSETELANILLSL